jgi:hypothetical protein
LRDRDLSIQRFAGDLFTDNHRGKVCWHAGCGSSWRGIDVAIVGGIGDEMTVVLEELPEGGILWVEGREQLSGSFTLQLSE